MQRRPNVQVSIRYNGLPQCGVDALLGSKGVGSLPLLGSRRLLFQATASPALPADQQLITTLWTPRLHWCSGGADCTPPVYCLVLQSRPLWYGIRYASPWRCGLRTVHQLETQDTYAPSELLLPTHTHTHTHTHMLIDGGWHASQTACAICYENGRVAGSGELLRAAQMSWQPGQPSWLQMPIVQGLLPRALTSTYLTNFERCAQGKHHHVTDKPGNLAQTRTHDHKQAHLPLLVLLCEHSKAPICSSCMPK